MWGWTDATILQSLADPSTTNPKNMQWYYPYTLYSLSPLPYFCHYSLLIIFQDRFAYYLCHKCKKPYFGGEKQCAVAAPEDFDPEELVSPPPLPPSLPPPNLLLPLYTLPSLSLSPSSSLPTSFLFCFFTFYKICGGCAPGAAEQNCSKHGRDYLEYKCRYCCSIAIWYEEERGGERWREGERRGREERERGREERGRGGGKRGEVR